MRKIPPRPFTTIALMGNRHEPRVAQTLDTLAGHLVGRGCTVRAHLAAGTRSAVPDVSRCSEARLADGADMAIAVGGDGSMLYATRRIVGKGIPLLGINQGRLGFLADISPGQMLARLDEVLDGDYVIERRMMLCAEIYRGRRRLARGLALNDVVVKRDDSGRMLEYQTFVDGNYVNTHLGDGIIVASPTGSTAYALSCGGPIIEPSLDALLLAPICPHTLSDRPIVIPGNRLAEVRLREDEPGKDAAGNACVTCDGEVLGHLGPGSRVRIAAAATGIELIHPRGYDYFGILRGKLHWGRDTPRGQATNGPAGTSHGGGRGH